MERSLSDPEVDVGIGIGILVSKIVKQANIMWNAMHEDNRSEQKQQKTNPFGKFPFEKLPFETLDWAQPGTVAYKFGVNLFWCRFALRQRTGVFAQHIVDAWIWLHLLFTESANFGTLSNAPP